jgi:hypothetical protein
MLLPSRGVVILAFERRARQGRRERSHLKGAGATEDAAWRSLSDAWARSVRRKEHHYRSSSLTRATRRPRSFSDA